MLDALARGAPSGAAAALLASLTAEPPWLDWGLLARGQEVYLRHLPSAGLVLFNVSLIGGFSAPKITKVLEQNGYLVGPPRLAMRRLFDTGRLMVDACASGPDALRAGGAGWRAAVRVRALHAKVRRRLLRRGGSPEPMGGILRPYPAEHMHQQEPGLHRQGGRHRKRRQGHGRHVLNLFWRTFHAASPQRLRQSAEKADCRAWRHLLAGQYRLDRRTLR